MPNHADRETPAVPRRLRDGTFVTQHVLGMREPVLMKQVFHDNLIGFLCFLSAAEFELVLINS